MSNNVQINTDEINKKLFSLNTLIKQEKKRNLELKLKLGIVEDKNNASTELITDYKDIYLSDYLRNWGLFLSILVAVFTITKVFRPSHI